MSATSPSEALWAVLHHAGALLTEGGFADACPPLPAGGAAAEGPGGAEGYDDLIARHGGSLAFGTTWPAGTGPGRPQALILSEAPLSDQALAFVRTWFENPRVNLPVAETFFVQSLPVLAGDPPPYAAVVRDLCALLKPKAVFSLGAVPAQRLLGAPLSVDTLRGSDYRFDRWSMVTTLDPEAYFGLPDEARNAYKAQVWKDLQRLLGKLKYG